MLFVVQHESFERIWLVVFGGRRLFFPLEQPGAPSFPTRSVKHLKKSSPRGPFSLFILLLLQHFGCVFKALEVRPQILTEV
jgi:hypothetical protein